MDPTTAKFMKTPPTLEILVVGWVVPWFGGVPLAAAGAGVLSVVAGGDGWTGAVGVATFGLARYGGDMFTGVGW